MELDFRKLYTTRLFDFSKSQEKLISEFYHSLFNLYDISIIRIEDSPYNELQSEEGLQLLTPKICYYVTDINKTNSFYLYITNKIWVTAKGAISSDNNDTLQIWGIKKFDENLEYISINRKKAIDMIAGIFNKFMISFSDDKDFNKNFYVLGTNAKKTRNFLTSQRRQTIQCFPEENFKIEIKNNILIFGLPKELTVSNAIATADFLKKI